MTKKIIRIATRQSPLALWQAEHVAELLEQAFPNVTTELVKMVTRGDKILDAPLAKVGGNGLFVKEFLIFESASFLSNAILFFTAEQFLI